MSDSQLLVRLQARVAVLEILLGEAVSSMPREVRAEFRDKAQRLFGARGADHHDYESARDEAVSTILNRIPLGGG